MGADPSQTLDLGVKFRFLQSRASGVSLAPNLACLDLLSLPSICLLKMWVPTLQFLAKTHLKHLISPNNAGCPEGEFLVWRWCPNQFFMYTES